MEKKAFQLLSNKLQGMAINRFTGAKGQLFSNWLEFSKEFQWMFETKNYSEEVNLIVELAVVTDQ